MSAASSFFCFLRDVRRPLTHIRGIAGYFALVDPLSLAVAPSSRAMFDTYDRSLCGGVPAVWPRAPRWPTDAALLAKIRASLAPERRMIASPYLLEPVMNQRLMDLAWTHFNHLIDTYEAEILGDHHTLEKWAELVCVPTG